MALTCTFVNNLCGPFSFFLQRAIPFRVTVFSGDVDTLSSRFLVERAVKEEVKVMGSESCGIRTISERGWLCNCVTSQRLRPGRNSKTHKTEAATSRRSKCLPKLMQVRWSVTVHRDQLTASERIWHALSGLPAIMEALFLCWSGA